MKSKKFIKNIIGTVLILTGICLMSYAIYVKYHTEHQKDRLVQQYEDYINWVNDSNLDVEEIEKNISQNTQTAKNGLDSMTLPAGLLGIMEIEKIDLVVTLAEGTDNKSITLSVGHFPNTAMPGEKGNFAVVGHRSYRYGAYFNRLDELENGDLIKIKTADGIFTYCVDDKSVVEPTETSVLDPTDDATITLVTCTPIRTATHRLIIKGHLV